MLYQERSAEQMLPVCDVERSGQVRRITSGQKTPICTPLAAGAASPLAIIQLETAHPPGC